MGGCTLTTWSSISCLYQSFLRTAKSSARVEASEPSNGTSIFNIAQLPVTRAAWQRLSCFRLAARKIDDGLVLLRARRDRLADHHDEDRAHGRPDPFEVVSVLVHPVHDGGIGHGHFTGDP